MKKKWWVLLIGLGAVFILGFLVFGSMPLFGPAIGNVFSSINASLCTSDNCPTSEAISGHPTATRELEPTSATGSQVTAEPAAGEDPTSAKLAQLDEILHHAAQASLAYNAPNESKLDETFLVQLLLNPAVSETELGQQVTGTGPVTTGTLEVTPRMKAILVTSNPAAFIVQPLHDQPEQVISATETTRWQWNVTAKQAGHQNLTLVVYRLVKYENQEYWREVESYRAEIEVKVSLSQQVQALDWKWLAGSLLTLILVPAFWRWLDQRQKKAGAAKKARKPS